MLRNIVNQSDKLASAKFVKFVILLVLFVTATQQQNQNFHNLQLCETETACLHKTQCNGNAFLYGCHAQR